jgi:hypothetical protein
MAGKFPDLPKTRRNQDVRLPSIPENLLPAASPPRPPPPQQAPSVLGVASTYESASVSPSWPRGVEQSIYITSQRWRACDVYVELPAGLSAGPDFTLSILVYSVSQRSRTLVATGRIDFSASALSTSTELRHWVAAARASSERYEVVARLDQLIGSPNLTGQPTITVVATDEMTPPPANIGAFSRFSQGAAEMKFQLGALPPPPRLEVLSVRGVNTVNLTRYLQLYDASITLYAQLAGKVPVFVWPLAKVAGEGISADVFYRCQLAPVLVISDNPILYNATGDTGAIGMTVR